MGRLRRAIGTVLAIVLFGLLSERAIAAVSQPVYVVTHVDVVPDHIADGRSILSEEGVLARKDPGCLSWELLQQADRPNHFTIVEAWAATADFDRHVATDHARSMRTKLQSVLGSPFDERLHTRVR